MNSAFIQSATSAASEATNQPLVSVIIPVYNRGALIEKTVQSVLNQTLPASELEIIIVDDGSTDESFAILQRLYQNHAQIQLFQIPNGGVAGARNFGLQRARGEFIAFLDHDDLWLPQKLESQLEAARRSDAGVVHCDWRAVDQNGEPMPALLQISQQSWWRGASGHVYPWVWMPHPAQFLRNPIISMSVPLVRTQLLRDSGGFDANVVPSDDWDLWIRLSQITTWAFVPQVTVHYVCHENQQHNASDAAYRSWLRLCRKHPANVRCFPLLWLKQQLLVRYCRAFICLPPAQKAASQGQRSRLFLWTLRALWQRPDVLLTHRWRRLWREALKH